MTATDRQNILLDDFAALPDWGERYRYIIALGAALPPMPEHLIIPANRVLSCASRTYFWVGCTDGALTIHADSNSAIPLGLAAILHRIYSGITPAQAAQTPLFFPEKSGLLHNLTGNRLMGFQEMTGKVRTKNLLPLQ
jgi:cysteine desulfuration protein SufE